MEQNKYQRRVVTKLPFAEKEAILEKTNGGIWLKGGKIYYSTYSASDNAVYILEENEKKLVEALWDNLEWLEEIGEVSAFVKNNNRDEVVIKLNKTVNPDILDTLGKFIQQISEKYLDDYYKSKGYNEGCPIKIE